MLKRIREALTLPVPAIKMTDRFRGFIVITYDSKYSVEFLRTTVESLEEPWSGARLGVKLMEDIPTFPKILIAVTLKDGPTFEEDIIDMLDLSLLQN